MPGRGRWETDVVSRLDMLAKALSGNGPALRGAESPEANRWGRASSALVAWIADGQAF